MNPSTGRISALDYARAWAIFGMIIVNYALAMQAEHEGAAWLHVISGMLQGRASALFIILAGIGVSLMTAKARNTMDRGMIRQQRMSLYRRSAFLFGAGLLLLLIGWNADILHYYAVFMLVAAALIHVSDNKILGLVTVVLILSQWELIQFDYSEGWGLNFHVYNDFWSLEGFARNLLFNGFHPIFPWVCFFLIGMWIGRKRGLLAQENRFKLLIYSLSGTIVIETLSYCLIRFSSPVLDMESAHYLFSTKPMPPTLLYVLSATSSAIAILAISLYVVHTLGNAAITRAFIHTGQLSLSHYIGHIVIGLGLLETVDYLENGSLTFAVAYSCAFFVLAIIFSYVWRKRMPRGPIELIMRKVC